MKHAFLFILALTLIAPLRAGAQPVAPSEIIQQIGIDQKLDAPIPLDATFRDETGKTVRIGDYFNNGKPVVLALVYYECPMLCTMTLNGMLKAFKVLPFTIGQEFDVVTVSFDPSETPALAAKKKDSYIRQYGRDNAGAAGWHFLTGDADSIKQLCDAIGFRYTFDEKTQQYAHASAIMVATPKGKLSKYFYGLEYVPTDLRLGLIEAAEERIGSPADHLLLFCYEYDPTTGKYGFAIMSVVRIGGILTVAAIGTFMFVMFRRDRNLAIGNGKSTTS